jgi:hypothetical protein
MMHDAQEVTRCQLRKLCIHHSQGPYRVDEGVLVFAAMVLKHRLCMQHQVIGPYRV